MKPILMNGPMVRATLNRLKTLTHRPLKKQPGEVRLRRIQDIAGAHRHCRFDIHAEGLPVSQVYTDAHALQWFIDLWDSIYAKEGLPYASNPWAWAYYYTIHEVKS